VSKQSGSTISGAGENWIGSSEALSVEGVFTKTFPAEMLREFCAHVFMYFGVSKSDATQAADVIAAADLRGIDSHGVARMSGYRHQRSRYSASISAAHPTVFHHFLITERLLQFRRFQIFVSSFPGFGPGVDSHRPLHSSRHVILFSCVTLDTFSSDAGH
jgi:hypothetical protein